MLEAPLAESPTAPADPKSSQRGFTLIEVLIAIVILIFCLIPVTNLLLVAGTSNIVGNQATAAATTATRYLERLKSLPFSDAALTAGGDLDITTLDAWSRTDDLRGVGTIDTRWVITDFDAQTKFIRVRSQARGALGRRSRAEFTTIRTCTVVAQGCPAI